MSTNTSAMSAVTSKAQKESPTVVVDQRDLVVAHKPAIYQSLGVKVAAEVVARAHTEVGGGLNIHPIWMLVSPLYTKRVEPTS